MSLFDLFAQKTTCPSCGDPGARKLLWVVKCRNVACARFDRSSLYEEAAPSERRAPPKPLTGSFDPGPNAIEVRYRNFRSEDKTFKGDRRTVRARGRHISVCLAPSGKRVAFTRERIGNLAEIEDALRKQPTPKERQIIGYHRKHRTTSSLYESIKQKYPGW